MFARLLFSGVELKPIRSFSNFRWIFSFLIGITNCWISVHTWCYFVGFDVCRLKSIMAPVLSLALPSETGRVLSIQSHTVQVLSLVWIFYPVWWVPKAIPEVKFSLIFLGPLIWVVMMVDWLMMYIFFGFFNGIMLWIK